MGSTIHTQTMNTFLHTADVLLIRTTKIYRDADVRHAHVRKIRMIWLIWGVMCSIRTTLIWYVLFITIKRTHWNWNGITLGHTDTTAILAKKRVGKRIAMARLTGPVAVIFGVT